MMKPILGRFCLCALTGLSAMVTAPAHAALLVHQPPSLSLGAVQVGSEGQGATLLETFAYAGTGHELAWWGTAVEQPGDLIVDLFRQGPGNTLLPLASAMPVTAASAAGTIDIEDSPLLISLPVFRYSIDLGQLAGGAYALSVREVGLNTPGGTWYWLTSAVGDGDSFSIVPELGDRVSNGVDLSLQVLGDRAGQLPLPGTVPLALCALLLAWRLGRGRALQTCETAACVGERP